MTQAGAGRRTHDLMTPPITSLIASCTQSLSSPLSTFLSNFLSTSPSVPPSLPPLPHYLTRRRLTETATSASIESAQAGMGNGVGPGAALDALIASLAEMGFSASASADALGRSGGNFERALVLLTGSPIICLRFHSPCYSKHDGILFLNVVCCFVLLARWWRGAGGVGRQYGHHWRIDWRRGAGRTPQRKTSRYRWPPLHGRGFPRALR